MKRYLHIIRRHKRPIRFIAAKLLLATGISPIFTINQPGFRLRFYPTNLSTAVWINRHARDDARSLFSAYTQAGDYIVDVGSNIGDTALCFSSLVGVGGHVVAVEPHPRTFRFLQGNLHLNRATNVTALNCALGPERGEVQLLDQKWDDMNRVVNHGGLVHVPMQILDDIVDPRQRVNLLKIDVEGFELPVLRGGGETLHRTDCVCSEFGAEHCQRYDYFMADMLVFLKDYGFSLFVQNGPQRLSPIPVTFKSEFGEELVAIRNERNFVNRTGWTIDSTVLHTRTAPLPHQRRNLPAQAKW